MASKKRKLDLDTTDDDSIYPSHKKQKLEEEHDPIIGLDDNDENINHFRNFNQIILNIGGIKHVTTLLTLSKYPQSVLYKMFEGKFSLKPHSDGSYFIDRDGTNFHYILNYLRTGILNIPQTNNQYLIKHLLIETDYYQLLQLRKLLIFTQKCPTKILKLNDIQQITQWMNERVESDDDTKVNIDNKQDFEYPNWILLEPHNDGLYRSCDLKGIDSLLFVFVIFNRKFGFYMNDIYGKEAKLFYPPKHPNQEILEEMERDEYEMQMLEEYGANGPPIPPPTPPTYNGFVFWLEPNNLNNNFHIECDSEKSIKYECDIKVNIYRSKPNDKSCNFVQRLGSKKDEICIKFKKKEEEQSISTDLNTFIGLRQYEFVDWYLYQLNKAERFVQNEEKIAKIEIFRVC